MGEVWKNNKKIWHQSKQSTEIDDPRVLRRKKVKMSRCLRVKRHDKRT